MLETIHESPFGKEYYDTEFCRVYLHEDLSPDESSEDFLTANKRFLKKDSMSGKYRKYEYKQDTEAYPMKKPVEPNFEEKQLDESICLAVSEILCGPSDHFKTKLLGDGKNNLWNFVKDYMEGNPWIPYDETKRRSKFRNAFCELKDYIQDP